MPPSKVTKQNQTIRQGPVQVADKNGPAWLTLMRNDFPLLRKAIIILGISLISCSAMVIAGKVLWNKQQTAMTLAQAQYNEALNNRNQIASDNQAIHDYQAKYLQLRERGFVGEERRLDWITQIKFIRENRKLLPITYEIAPQQVEVKKEEPQLKTKPKSTLKKSESSAPVVPKSTAAKKDFEKAEEHYNSGLKEYSSGYISKAIEEWESCLKYNPNHERAKNALAKARKTLKK